MHSREKKATAEQLRALDYNSDRKKRKEDEGRNLKLNR